MARRGKRLGLLAAAAGAIGAAVVALVLVIGLQQEMASMRDELASRTTELGNLRAQIMVLETQTGGAEPLAALEQRVSTLETAVPDVSRPGQDLTARRFALVDDQGEELAVLGVDRVGFPELRLLRGASPAHAAALALGWTEHGPALRVLDAAGNAPVFVGVTNQGPALTLNAGGEGGAGASLQVDAQGGSTLALTDNDGLAQAALTLSPAAVTSTPSLSFSRWTVFGHERLFLGYDTNGPQVVLSNLKDAPRIRLGFDQGDPSISVHDASATPRLEMVEADEIVGLRLWNAKGQEHAALFSTQDNSALQLIDATQVRAALVGDPDGSTLVLNDAQANPRTLLYFNEEVGSALDFLNEHGSNRAVFRTLDTGGALGFLDDQGTVRTTFAFADDGGVLAFFDEHETTRVSLTSSSDAEELVFHDEHATERAVLASGPAGPALELRDAQGTIRAELGFDASGGPGLDLRDPQGALAATLSSSAAGRLLALYGGEDGRRLSLAINEGGAGLTIFDDPDTLRTHLGFLAEDLALLFMDENERARVIMGFDLNTLEPIFLTRDAEGNETWRSGPAGGP